MVTHEQQHKRMTETPMGPLLASMSFPTIMSQLVSVLYNTADTWFVSQISTSASAAVGVSFALMSLIQAVGCGFGTGANSLISRALGARENHKADVFASSAFFGTLVCGILMGAAGLVFLEPLMRLLGSTDTILPYSCKYARYILLSAPLMCTSFVFNIVLRSEGQAGYAMIGLCSGGILNVLLDPLFIFVFDFGISGAAMATALSQVVSFLVLGWAYVSGRSIVRIRPSCISKEPGTYREILATGSPTIFRQGLGSLSTSILNSQAALYGDAAVAAISIVNKVYMIVRHIVLGLGQGFQPIAGYNYGAGNKARTKEAFRLTCAVGSVICLAMAGILGFNAEAIIRWFRNDDTVVAIGSQAMLYSCCVMPFMAYSTYVNQLYQCLGFKVGATILASCRQGICFLPLAFLLPSLLGLQGLEMVQPGADFLTFLISIPFQITFFRAHLTEEPPGSSAQTE